MAKTAASVLITDLAKRLDLNPGAQGDASAERLDCLRQLNISQQAILQDFSLRFLVTDGFVTLANNASSAAVPTTIDDGKMISLGRNDASSDLEYVEPDAWYKLKAVPDGALATAPIYYTISLVAGVLTFSFSPTNTTGGSINIPYKAQLIPVAMTDLTNSFSMLPEGWEDTLLLDHAEAELRRFNGEAVPDYLAARVASKQALLYGSYRSTKEQPMTDREQMDRKAARETMSPEEKQAHKRRGQDM